MGKYHGKNVRIYINGYDISPLVAGVTPNQSVEMSSYAVADGVDGYHHVPGIARDTLTIEGIFDDNYQTQLNNLRTAADGYQVVIPFAQTLGSRAFACNEARLTTYNWRDVVTDVNRLTAELVTEGLPWDECKLIFPKATKTTNGEHTSIDDASATSDGIIAYLQVFECGGDDALIVKIQHSADDGDTDAWTDLVTFTTANGITTERKTTDSTVKRYLRVTWSGTPTYSGTFAVVYKRI